ncbi:4Fe-4S dicluster domain-containing protein [Eggerthella lenta]|uniref:4Fe-4S dicluster domain-containing protein n=1 Tax=Eggerthella lenta TaxID=84112 RepID=UPI000DF80515|nr:4Fe-4S dicluster domain-containing protein [Eggerthella lenta]RDC03132.1 4Fe-4S ferredoxin [Eggerthella lenta]
MTKYGMAIDMRRCFGCKSCAVACKCENNLPDGVWWNQAKTVGGEVDDTPAGEAPSELSMKFFTFACQHCDKPACVEVCPTGASAKRDDGIVTVDYEACIGCKSCITACPYEGVRTYIDGEPAWFLDFAVGDIDAPAHRANVVEKCTFCAHRIDRGERPACVDICRAQARFWGDLDDPDSDVSRLLAEREYEQLLIENGTGPNVYLLKA